MDYTERPVDYDPFAADATSVTPSLVTPAEAALPPIEKPAMVEPPTVEPPVPQPAPPPIPPIQAPAAAPSYKATPVDYDPFAPDYNPASDYAVTRGAKAAFHTGMGAIETMAKINRITQMPADQRAAEMLKQDRVDPTAAKMQVPGLEDIGGVGDALTFAGESIGQMFGSVGAAMVAGGAPAAGVGALAGGAAGATAFGAGAIPGAVAGAGAGFASGTAGHFVAQGVAGTYQDLMSDEGVRKGLADGTISPDTVFQFAIGAGSVIGMIDVIPQAHLAQRLGLKEVSKDAVKTTLLKAAKGGLLRQAGEEGGTEALQGAISELGQAVIGGNTNAGQRALSVLNQGAAGAFGGAGPGALGGVVENARVPDKAAPAQPPGVPDAAAALSPGMSSPGGTGTAAPPLVAVPPETPAPAAVVIPPGQVDPTLAAATAPEIPAAGPSSTAAGVAEPAGISSPLPPAAQSETLAPDEVPVETDEDLVVPPPEVAKTAAERIKAVLDARAKKAETVTAGPVDADLKVAIAAAQPLAPAAAPVVPSVPPPVSQPAVEVTPAAPAVLRPEPIGTVAAAERRAQPVIAPVEAAPLAPARNASVAAAEPIVALAPQEPVGAVSPVPAVPVQPTAPPTAVPQPAAVAPKINAIGRQLAGRVRQELINDQLTENPDYNNIVDQVAAELTSTLPRGTAPARAVEGNVAAAVSAVRERLTKAETSQAAAAAETERVRGEEQMARAAAIARKRETEGKPQERKRAGKKGKKAQAIADEGEPSTLRAYKRELKKPEAERDPDLIAWGEAHTARAAFAKKGAPVSRAEHTETMKAAQARRVAKAEAAEAEARPPEVVPSTTPGEEVDEETRKSDEMHARNKVVSPAIGEVFNATPEPNWDRIPTTAKFKSAGRAYIQDIVTKAIAALKAAGQTLHAVPSRNYSLEENIMIFARKVLAEKDPNGLSPVDFITAMSLARSGQFADFYNAITGDTMGGSQLEGGEKAFARQLQEDPTYDEGSNQFHAMDRGAATEAALLDLSRTQREAIERTLLPDNSGPESFTLPHFGAPTIEVQRRTDALTLLREVTGDAYTAGANRGGLYGIVRRAVLRRLRQTVGDLAVRFANQEQFDKIKGQEKALAFYQNVGHRDRAAGWQPHILINSDRFNTLDAAEREDLVVHEMMHAATSFALATNLHGTNRILTRLRDTLRQHLVREGKWDALSASTKYGFTDEHEFLAEAFSNPDFQQILADTEVPAKVRDQIGLRPAEAKNTWWDALVNTVANALGLRGLHARTTTYLDQVMRLTPGVELSSEQQQARAVQLRGIPSGPFDVHALRRDVQDALDAMKGRHGHRGWNRFSRWLTTKMVTTEQMKRLWIDQGGAANDAFVKLTDLFLGQSKRRARRREAGNLLTAKLHKYSTANHQAGQDLSDYLHDATRSEVDGSEPLAHPNNKHIHKTGPTHAHLRAAHARAVTAWNKLDAEGKALAKELTDHYSAQENERLRLLVRNTIEQVMRPKENGGFGVVLPAGKTIDDAVEWVQSGAIDRPASEDPASPKLGERTPDDIAWHAALGKTADTLTGTAKMRRIRGTYVPLMRWGKYFFTATHKVPTPAGAVEDPTGKDGSAFIFLDKNDLTAFTSATDEQISNVQQQWFDPATGKRTTKTASYVNAAGVLVDPVPGWRVSIQNRIMEMDDSEGALARRRDEYVTNQGFNMPTEVAIVDTLMHGKTDILPRQINRLINNIRQSTEGNVSIGQQANVNAVVDAYVRQLSGSRAAHRRLKRANVGGFSRDLVAATLRANRTMAGHLANLETSSEMARLDNELSAMIDVGRRTSYPSDPAGTGTLRRQEQIKELRYRIEAVATRNEENWGERLLNGAIDASFVVHLATPSYTATNLMQPFATTYPVLATAFGDGAALGAMGRAYRDLGTASTIGRGFRQTGREILLTGQRVADFGKRVATGRAQPIRELRKDTFESHHIDAMNRMAGKPDSALFNQFMDKLEQLGFDASAGLETADVSGLEKNTLERGVERGTRIARAMAEAAEAVNRYVTGLAALRLAKSKGMTDEAAVDYAITTVEKTQGGYATENNPRFLGNRWARFPLQFKKYSVMYGQLYYGALARAINPGSSMAVRKDAGKSLVRLSAMAMLFAGVSGVAPMELARVLVLLSSGLLGGDDWETWENTAQGWFTEALKWATGSEAVSARTGEALMHGASRYLGVDMSSRLGNDSMVLFGQPQKMDEAGTKSWLFDLLAGAPGGVVSDAFQGKVPLPKLATDIAKAGDEADWYDAAVRAFGFRTATKAREWEYGGGAAASKAEKLLKIQRTTLMTKYAEADPGRRAGVWRTDIAAWNRAHRSKKERIEFSDLRRSLQTRKQKARERAKAN